MLFVTEQREKARLGEEKFQCAKVEEKQGVILIGLLLRRGKKGNEFPNRGNSGSQRRAQAKPSSTRKLVAADRTQAFRGGKEKHDQRQGVSTGGNMGIE